MSDVSNETVYAEKFRNTEKEIEQMKVTITKLEEKVNEAERKVDKIDGQLSMRLVQLEAKLEYHTKFVSDKVDGFAKEIKETNEKVEKKMDEYLKATKSSTDTFKDWALKIGMKLLEYGVYGGVLYAVAKGLKLF